MTYANHYVFLWHFIMCFCGILLRVFVINASVMNKIENLSIVQLNNI